MTIPRLLPLVLLVVACTVLGVAVVALSERDQAAGSERLAVSSGAPVDGPVSVLHAWDQRRAAAWAAGDVSGLRALYTERSTAGDRDAARLTQWLERGLRVRKMQTQVLRAQVLEKLPGVLVLSVTDRVVRAVATGKGPAVPLPADSPSTWRITMRQVWGEWRVASVYASPVARTSSTPGSANR